MEDNIKIVHSKNLNQVKFNQTLNIPINDNANIKTILNVDAYLFDQKAECGNGKAIIGGKVGVKVLYLDTDNLMNTVNESMSFSETYVDNAITTDTFLNLLSCNVTPQILDTSSMLKINCEATITPIAYINLNAGNTLMSNEMLITKKSEVSTCTISKYINTSFEHFLNFDTSDEISKILYTNSTFAPEKTTAFDGYIVVEGKISTAVIYETQKDGQTAIKELKEISVLKSDVAIDGLTKDSNLDLSFMFDKSNAEISTELEDNNNIINIKQKLCVVGTVLSPMSLEFVDDLFSTTNQIETTTTKREYTTNVNTYNVSEIVSNEINLTSQEPAIDEIISNLNSNAEITNIYLKDEIVYVEGIITSNLTYVDENKEYKHKILESPFIINTKINKNKLDCTHSSINIVDSKVKVKRGTIIETEYTLFVNLVIYEKETKEIVDNFTLGKALDYSKFDFQIYLAKPNETTWELCKRTKISPNDIHKYNKDLPPIMEGGERIIIRR